MREIPLTQGLVATVDDVDYAALAKFKWYAHKASTGTAWYAHRQVKTTTGKQTTITMHRQILGFPAGRPTTKGRGF
jgi:hypothetical protein